MPGPTDPLEHLRVVEIELTLADLETVESRIDRRQKALRADPRDPGLTAEVDALETALESLSDGTPLYRAALSKDRQLALPNIFFSLTSRYGGSQHRKINWGKDLSSHKNLEALQESQVLPLSVQLEAEAACSQIANEPSF